jgi:hypothetical protein
MKKTSYKNHSKLTGYLLSFPFDRHERPNSAAGFAANPSFVPID